MFKVLHVKTDLFTFGCAEVNIPLFRSVRIDIWWCCGKFRSILVAVFLAYLLKQGLVLSAGVYFDDNWCYQCRTEFQVYKGIGWL